MPGSPEELEAALDAEDTKRATVVQGALGGAIPRATEPLDAATVNALSDILEQVVPVLSGGQVPDLELPRVEGTLEQVPPEVGAPVLTAAAFIDQFPAAKEYAFDPIQLLASNQGIGQIGALLGKMARDPRVLQAVQSGGAGAPPPEEPAAEPPMEG